MRDALSTRDYLVQFRNRRVLYLPNPGNAGDSLISAAAVLLMRRLSINFETIDLGNPVDGEIVILGGGGNLVPAYDTIASAYRRFLGRAKTIILLPHTIRGNEKLLGSFDRSCVIFCRDPESYMHVLEHAPNATSFLGHDMAFQLDPEELLFAKPGPQHQAFFTDRLRAAGVDWDKAAFRQTGARYFRRDGESSGMHPNSDLDISTTFEKGVWPENAFCAAWAFLEAIRTVETVETDRLHVGIGAALVGTPCKLFDNSYGKNAAIFRHSIRNHYSNVQFLGGVPAG